MAAGPLGAPRGRLVPRDAVAPNVTLGDTEFACDTAGCTAGPFRSRAALGVHRWNAHKLRSKSGKPSGAQYKAAAKAKAGPAAGNSNPPSSGGTPKPPGPSPKAPSPTGRRKDGTEFCGGAWKLATSYLVPKVSPGAAVVMKWQAPQAGGILDAAIAHTRLDRMIVQRAAGKGMKLKAVASLLLLPGMVMAAERQPALVYDLTFQGMLRGVVKDNYRQLLAGKIKENQEVAELQEMAEEAGVDYWATDADGNLLLDEKGRKVPAIDGLVAEILGMIAQPEGVPA